MSDTPEPGAPLAAPMPTPVQVSVLAGRGGGNLVLDLIVVGGAMWIVHDCLQHLFSAQTIQTAQLTIIAGTLGTVIALVGAYSAFRWGASDAMKKSGQGPAQ